MTFEEYRRLAGECDRADAATRRSKGARWRMTWNVTAWRELRSNTERAQRATTKTEADGAQLIAGLRRLRSVHDVDDVVAAAKQNNGTTHPQDRNKQSGHGVLFW
jgi:hypothetical protein